MQEESEVPDDETVNQMIARNEEEFEIYQVRILFPYWISFEFVYINYVFTNAGSFNNFLYYSLLANGSWTKEDWTKGT